MGEDDQREDVGELLEVEGGEAPNEVGGEPGQDPGARRVGMYRRFMHVRGSLARYGNCFDCGCRHRMRAQSIVTESTDYATDLQRTALSRKRVIGGDAFI
jgi:hypothetical protein